MELPPDDLGPDLDKMRPLPDQGLLLPELPEDDMLGDHLTDHDWLVGQLGDIMEAEDHDLVPAAPPEALEMDICEMSDAVPLPDDICRVACRCKHNCIKAVMMKEEGLVHHLRTEVRDKQFLLEFVKHSHLSKTVPRLQTPVEVGRANYLHGCSRCPLGHLQGATYKDLEVHSDQWHMPLLRLALLEWRECVAGGTSIRCRCISGTYATIMLLNHLQMPMKRPGWRRQSAVVPA